MSPAVASRHLVPDNIQGILLARLISICLPEWDSQTLPSLTSRQLTIRMSPRPDSSACSVEEADTAVGPALPPTIPSIPPCNDLQSRRDGESLRLCASPTININKYADVRRLNPSISYSQHPILDENHSHQTNSPPDTYHHKTAASTIQKRQARCAVHSSRNGLTRASQRPPPHVANSMARIHHPARQPARAPLAQMARAKLEIHWACSVSITPSQLVIPFPLPLQKDEASLMLCN